MKQAAIALYVIGSIAIVLGFLNGTLADAAIGCESPIGETCLALSGNAALLAKGGALAGIAGWLIDLFDSFK